MKGRRVFVWIAALAALMLAGCAAGTASPSSATGAVVPIKFHYDWVPTSGDVPMLAAEKFGYFSDAGLSVTTTPGGPQINCAQLVASGAQDICISPAVGIIPAHGTGVPYKAVGLIQQKAPYGLIVGPDRGIDEPRDLEGKTVGTQPENTYYALWKAFIKAQGLDESSITEVAIGFGPGPLFNGQVDAVPDFISLVPAQVTEHYGEPAITFLFADYDAWAAGQAIIVNNDFAAEQPDAVRGFLEAYRRGMDWALKNEADAIDLVVESYPDLTEEIVSVELPALLKFWTSPDSEANGLLWSDDALWQRTYDMLLEYGFVEQEFDVKETYTNEYLSPA
jgi:ABC-type nitrate/sulfonate/bicarbonate transport system substrate-binding protein